MIGFSILAHYIKKQKDAPFLFIACLLDTLLDTWLSTRGNSTTEVLILNLWQPNWSKFAIKEWNEYNATEILDLVNKLNKYSHVARLI